MIITHRSVIICQKKEMRARLNQNFHSANLVGTFKAQLRQTLPSVAIKYGQSASIVGAKCHVLPKLFLFPINAN